MDTSSDRTSSDWQRRRRIAEVFGEVLPHTTGDERDPSGAPDDDGAPARGGEGADDRWLREQVPPHHDR